MSLKNASKTMQAVCAARVSRPDLQVLDPLLSEIYPYLPEAENCKAFFDQITNGMFSETIYLRTLLFSKILNDSAEEFQQVIMLSCGMDFRLLSDEKWKNKAKILVDHPKSLELSLNLLNKVRVKNTVNFIPMDLSVINFSSFLKILNNSGFSSEKKTLILWEGSSYYFKKGRVLKLFKYLEKLNTPLRFCFDYVNDPKKIIFDAGLQGSINYVKKENEPWQSKFNADEISQFLSKSGFVLQKQIPDTQWYELLNIPKQRDMKHLFTFIDCQNRR